MTIVASTDINEIIKLEQDTVDIIEETLIKGIGSSVDSQVAQIRNELNYGLSPDAYIEDGTSPFYEEARALESNAEDLINEFNNFEETARALAKKQVLKELEELVSKIKERIKSYEDTINKANNKVNDLNSQRGANSPLVTVYNVCPNYNNFVVGKEKYTRKLALVESQIKSMG